MGADLRQCRDLTTVWWKRHCLEGIMRPNNPFFFYCSHLSLLKLFWTVKQWIFTSQTRTMETCWKRKTCLKVYSDKSIISEQKSVFTPMYSKATIFKYLMSQKRNWAQKVIYVESFSNVLLCFVFYLFNIYDCVVQIWQSLIKIQIICGSVGCECWRTGPSSLLTRTKAIKTGFPPGFSLTINSF